MDAKLLALCEAEFVIGVKMLFNALEKSTVAGESWLRESPYTGKLFIAGLENPDDFLIPQVCRALRAREQFRQDAPRAYQPLPLRQEDCDDLMNADNTRLQIVGLYASSWRCADWDRKHPCFDRFCSGLMEYPSTPDHIRTDRSLLQEFPPRRLVGFADGCLHWRSPATINFDREHEARCAAFIAQEQSAPR